MKIEKTGDTYFVTSSKGDKTSIQDKGHYLDLRGSVGPERQVGEVRGAHGVFDNVDSADSHVNRDGTRANSTDQMIDSWKARPEENLFNKAAGGPAAAGTGGAKPANGGGNAPGTPAAGNPAALAPGAPGAPGATPANPAAPGAAPAGPAGKGGPEVGDDIKAMLSDLLKALKELIANLEKLLAKLGADAGKGGPAPAAAAQGENGARQAGKGGPAGIANFADQKRADKDAGGAPKTYADQQ
jgi:hypothetical protein